MKILSVNAGPPREVTWNGRRVVTGIYKDPVTGPVAVRRHNLDGDRQADRTVHGGPNKAVYLYPARHYEFWRRELHRTDLPFGMFGENLTIDGVDEDSVAVGDHLRAGGARLVVTEPRLPCYKLGIRFGDAGMPERFLRSGRTGFYCAVVDEGAVRAGDAVEIVGRHPERLLVADVTRLHAGDGDDARLLRRAIGTDALPPSWRARFERRMAALEGS